MQIVKQTAYGIVIMNFMNNKCFKLPFDYPKMRADQLVDIYIYVCVCACEDAVEHPFDWTFEWINKIV